MKAELTNEQVKFWTYFVGKTEDILILILVLINTVSVNNISVMCILNPYTTNPELLVSFHIADIWSHTNINKKQNI